MAENSHVVTTPNQKPLQPIESVKQDLYKDINKVTVYFNGDKDEANRFVLSSYEYVRRVPRLLETGRESLLMAFLQAASFRFMPSGVGGEAYIIPYGKEAKFQLGYQGVVTLLYRTEKISAISANIVYENDLFSYEEGLEPILKHVPVTFGKPRGDAVGVYVVAQMRDGAKAFKVMDKDAIMGIKALSKAKDSKDSPWNSNLDPEKWMWKKTCLLQLAKTLPKTADLQKAIAEDYEGEGLDKPRLDAAGPATARASHKPEAKVVEPPATAPEGKKCPAGKHAADKMSTGECEYCTNEEFDQRPAEEKE